MKNNSTQKKEVRVKAWAFRDSAGWYGAKLNAAILATVHIMDNGNGVKESEIARLVNEFESLASTPPSN